MLVDADSVTMRIGFLKSVRVPAAHIAGLRTSWPREELKRRGVLNFALINYPNVMLDLDPPLPSRQTRPFRDCPPAGRSGRFRRRRRAG